MTDQEYTKTITQFMESYCEIVRLNLDERWKKIPLNLYDSEVYEVIGGLLARQATLSIQLAENPMIWNPHIAPLILRSMTDAHITLAWILTKEFEERARQYILYGLGQEKKLIEHFKNESDNDEDIQSLIDFKEKWIESQRYPFLTEVNLGSWSGSNTRIMAQEADCESLYKFAYEPFSAVAHNMWQHISLFNLKQCTNPLHKYHKVPAIHDVPLSEDYVFQSSKYLSKSFESFDKKFGLIIDTRMPIDWYIEHIDMIDDEDNV
jgi:hypothetical protein